MPDKPKNQNLELNVILSSKTKQGMVQLILNGETISQWDIRKAKEIHGMLGEAIEAAVSDTFIFNFMVTKVGLSEDKAAAMLMDFREFRQGSRETVFIQ